MTNITTKTKLPHYGKPLIRIYRALNQTKQYTEKGLMKKFSNLSITKLKHLLEILEALGLITKIKETNTNKYKWLKSR